MTTLSASPSDVDSPASFASLPPLERAHAWVSAAREATGDDGRSESFAEAAHAFAEAGDRGRAVECLDALLALAEPKIRAAQRAVDAATLLGEHGRALRLYTWVLPTISLDEKRASTAITLADEAARLADRPLERFFLREAMAVRRSEELLARFAQSAVSSAREDGALDDDDRQHAVLSLVHLARRHGGEAGFAYASSALELDASSDDALELFVDHGIEGGLHDAVRERLEAAVFVLGAARQSVALGRLAASLDNRPTAAIPDSGHGIASIVELEELESAHADPRVEALLREAASVQSFPSLHVTKLREVLVLDPLQPEALGALRGVLASRGDHEGLRDVLVEAAEAAKARQWPVFKRLPIVRELAELCAETLDDPIGAIEALEELVRSDARNVEARTALRAHLERVGRWDAVVALVEDGLAGSSAPADALAELARIHVDRRRDAGAAAAVLLRRAQILATDAAAWRELIQLVRSLRDTSKLEATLVEALAAIGPTLTTTERAALAEELAGLRRASGDLAGAETLFSDAALATRDARLFAEAEACASELRAFERAARAALAQADLADERARAGHLVRAAEHFADAGARKLTLATLRDAVGAGASPGAARPALARCARDDSAEVFEWVATLALRTQRDRSEWLAQAEALIGGQSSSPRAFALTKELLRLEATVSRLRLLEALPWTSDDEVRTLVEGVATRADGSPALRTEAALLCCRAGRSTGDHDSAMRVLRTLPAPLDSRVVAELLELGRGRLGAHEELELIDQSLAGAAAGDAVRARLLERAAALAAARGDARRGLRYALELLECDPDDFDRLADATRLARDLGDHATLERCLERAIEAEADEDTLAALVRERVALLEGPLGRPEDAFVRVVEHARTVPSLRTAAVALAERHGLVRQAAHAITGFEGGVPAEANVDGWLARLAPNDDWLALAKAAAAKGALASRRCLAVALERGESAHARELYAILGPAPSAEDAVQEARLFANAGLAAEAFACASAYVGLPAEDRPADLVRIALELAPTASEAIATLARVNGLPREDFHDTLSDVLARIVGGPGAIAAVLKTAGASYDDATLAQRTPDPRIVEALVWDERPRSLEACQAIVSATDRLALGGEARIEARAKAWAAHPALVQDRGASGLSEADWLAALERAVTRNAASDTLAVELVKAYAEGGRLEDAQRVAIGLVERSASHRELLESVFERRGAIAELVASLEKRWSLEKDAARRVGLARRIAETLEGADADPREVADAWRRVLRLDPKDGHATSALERAKARALGAPRAALSSPPPPPSPVSVASVAPIAPWSTEPVATPRADALSMTAIEELVGAPGSASTRAIAGVPSSEPEGAFAESSSSASSSGEIAATSEDAEVDAPADDVLALTSANDHGDVPEALGSSDLLEDGALESIVDAEELD